MGNKKAALIEIYDSHDETLYSQLLFLKAGGYDTTLIASERVRNKIADYETGQKTVFVNITGKKGLAQWRALWQLRNYIIREGFGSVIFNTAHSNPVRNLCLLPFPKRISFYGTLHGVNKLSGSVTQKIISRRIPNYYLLNDYMLTKALRMPHRGLRFGVFYAMFHPEFKEVPVAPKRHDECWIAIPGAVEYKRRDYLTLLNAFAALPRKPKLRFLLLGNGDHAHGNGPELQQCVKELGLEDYFVFHHGFLPNDVFHQYLRHCDAVLPLIHPINADMEKYLENQISGSYNLAFAYRKPLLMHEYFRRYADFTDTALFYSLESFGHLLEALPALLLDSKDRFYKLPKWDFSYQASRYLELLKK